ncbi:MAG: GIY-YIG nuclease family protein, partial [Cyclobacteriaceae bacterium]|nr:GIY-YIG nuclease family protein [Cyclobacteriaceae bacterium]
VYIIKSLTTGKFYCGQSKNLKDRIERHNNGLSKYTKHGIPWVMIWNKECQSRAEAMLLESKIKKRGISRFIQSL